MKMVEFKRLVLELIENGQGSIPALTDAVKTQAVFKNRAIGRKKPRVGSHTTYGSPLRQALRELSHERLISFDATLRRYVPIGRQSYHPPVAIEKLIDEHSASIPADIEKEILLL